MKKSITLALSFFIVIASFAGIRLPALVSSNMVLQQQTTIKLWGWAEPADKVIITTSWNNKTDSVVTTRDATWQMNIQTPAAGGPYTITLKSGNTIVLENILIGEVWVCSGQSNMEFSYNNGIKEMKDEFPNCYNNNIRFFHIPRTTSLYPQDDCKAQWVICDSNSLKAFTSVGYFFGKKLNKDLNVPIGLINTSWGGTAAEAWVPAEMIAKDPVLQDASDKQRPAPWWPYKPALAYNGMIAPLFNYTIAGAIWYQGEANSMTAGSYSKLLTGMIDAWRKQWNKDFPFYLVQIAPFTYDRKNISALLREAQTQTTTLKNTGMVVITDLVDNVRDIHPQNKHDVGYRLANWALAETYHKEGIVYKSPVYKEMVVEKGKAIISFDNLKSGLQLKDKKIKELYVAGEDKVFHPAEAAIVPGIPSGENDKIMVWSKEVANPAAVRYAFSNTAIGNLFSKEGLPVNAFRTDQWTVDTSRIAMARGNANSKWMGFNRTDFTLQGRKCLVVEPLTAAAGKPWIWRTEFFGHEPQADSSLVAKGFHVVYMDVQDMYGAPVALDLMDKFYDYLLENRGLNNKTVLEGFSRGGLFAFNWAARHPDRVSSMYVDAPVCDFKSWPAGKGKGTGSPDDWEKLKKVYGFASDKEAMEYTLNPIDNLTPLAKARIPILCVCGKTDDTVPMAENISIVAGRYKKMGGKIKVIAKPDNGHHPHSLKDPKPIVDFILSSAIL